MLDCVISYVGFVSFVVFLSYLIDVRIVGGCVCVRDLVALIASKFLKCV